jgi:hypothetical protein
MEYKLKVQDNLSVKELEHLVNSGCRFISFTYCISIIFAVTLRRFSPAILIIDRRVFNKNKFKYNLLTILFGWWGFPWGPIFSVRALNVNRKGGIDVTDDIMLNITEDSLKNRIIELKSTKQMFCRPDKWDSKSFKKALVREFGDKFYIRKIVIGFFINTREGERPYYVIGLRVRGNFEDHVTKIRKALSTEFRKTSYFEFINLDIQTEMLQMLEEQGETIIEK